MLRIAGAESAVWHTNITNSRVLRPVIVTVTVQCCEVASAALEAPHIPDSAEAAGKLLLLLLRLRSPHAAAIDAIDRVIETPSITLLTSSITSTTTITTTSTITTTTSTTTAVPLSSFVRVSEVQGRGYACAAAGPTGEKAGGCGVGGDAALSIDVRRLVQHAVIHRDDAWIHHVQRTQQQHHRHLHRGGLCV